MFNIVRFMLVSAAVTTSLPAMANEMQCGQHYISGGQIEPLSQEQVLDKCGEPTSKLEEAEHWYYEDQGKVLVFNSDGKLMTIRDAGED